MVNSSKSSIAIQWATPIHMPREVTHYGTLVRIHVQKKNDEKGLFLSQNLQKEGIFAKKGRCLTEDTPVTPIKGVLW